MLPWLLTYEGHDCHMQDCHMHDITIMYDDCDPHYTVILSVTTASCLQFVLYRADLQCEGEGGREGGRLKDPLLGLDRCNLITHSITDGVS